MLLLGGAVMFNVPDPAVNDIPTRRASKSNPWVEEPGRTRTAWVIFAASGVETVNAPPQPMLLGALVMLGCVAATTLLFPSRVNKYAGL